MAKKRSRPSSRSSSPPGQATPAPPVGTALGPHGVAIMDFCKQYNAATENQRGTIVPVEITIYEDRSFTFVLKTPPTPVLLRQAAGLDKGATTAGREEVGTVTDAQVAEIATIKLPDLNANDLEAAKKQVAGTARSMGIPSTELVDPGDPSPARRTGRSPDTAATAPRHDGEPDPREPTWRTARSTPTQPAGSTASSCYAAAEAVDLVKSLATAKFDETVELAVRLGVDPRKADQIVRGTVALPVGHRQGRPRRRVRRR